MDDLVENKDKPSSRLMNILAGGLLFSAWLAFLWPLVRYQFWQSDTFWLIEVGRLILEKHCLPVTDPYSFTATASPWIIYQWLTEVIFSLANSAFGLTGVAIFGEALLAVLFCVLIFRRLLKSGTNPMVGVAAVWLSAYAFYPDISSLRPQLLSFVLFWLLAAVCADCKKGLPIWKALIQTFIITVVWANCHVSFPIVLLILVPNIAVALLSYVRKVGDKRLPILFAAVLATFAAATLVTPYGFSLWSFVLNAHNFYYSEEVAPLNWLAAPLLMTLAGAVCLSSLYLRKRLDVADLLAMLALAYVGSSCGRLIVYFCIFTCPIVGDALTQLLRPLLNLSVLRGLSESLKTVARSRFYFFGILLLSVFVVVRQPIFLRRNVPVQAAKFLADHPIAGNLFCSAHIGSYLIYSSHGAIPVFMDTRMDLYNNAFVTRFAKAMKEGDGWKELFVQYKIAAALLPNGFKLQFILDKQPDWKLIYQDPDFSLYIQNSLR